MKTDMEHILVVEDDTGISSFIKLELMHEGYKVTVAEDGRAGLELFETSRFDLVLLDVMLPGLNGIEVLRRIRKKSVVPVIMVTARGETMDTVTGLDAGADDYIPKPFAIEELLARIRSLLRRNMAYLAGKDTEEGHIIKIKNIMIDTDACSVYRDGEQVYLTRIEYMLLLCLARNRNKALGREQIIDMVWGEDHYIDINSVDVYVRYLRSKLDDPDGDTGSSIIRTLRGIGYSISDT